MTSPNGQTIFAATFTDVAPITGIADARRQLFEHGPRRAAPVVTRAVERGEIPATIDPEELIKTLTAPSYFQLTVTGEPVNQAAADRAARIALAAARDGALDSAGAQG
ncbi:TetR-like C-terminal domain-containing protein [Micromonospora sp. NPDC048898]|uniref:TetR-like C-terminal domain-containing protein n=1 Tax=Micromonospora sp. NPDC048898 TaxID=3364260 RepID=UPI0037169BE2